MKNTIKNFVNKNITLIEPETIFIGENVTIEDGVTIYPHAFINDHVTIKSGCTIHMSAYLSSHITLNENVFIGQYTILRDKVMIGSNTSIGPHCELVRSILGANCKIGHKNYIGDAILQDNVYFGAGAMIANSNWETTFKTTIGSNSKIGVNATLVSPLNIGSNCFISAGALVKKDVPNNTFVKVDIVNQLKPNKLK